MLAFVEELPLVGRPFINVYRLFTSGNLPAWRLPLPSWLCSFNLERMRFPVSEQLLAAITQVAVRDETEKTRTPIYCLTLWIHTRVVHPSQQTFW